jgi:hypothetical protein
MPHPSLRGASVMVRTVHTDVTTAEQGTERQAAHIYGARKPVHTRGSAPGIPDSYFLRLGTFVQNHSNSRNVSSLLLGVRSRSTNLVRLLPVFRMSFLFRSSNVLHTPSTGPTYR